MSIPNSTVKAAKSWLYTHIQSALTSDPLSSKLTLGVFYDHPGIAKPDDMVVVGDVNRQVAVSAMVGNEGAFSFEETYTIDVVVSVYRAGPNAAQAAFERACDLMDGVITTQRGDPTLGGVVVVCRPQDIAQPSSEPEEDAKGFLAEQSVKFFCRAIY